jgi:predicted SAM-dependent methyltransferase
MPIPHSIKNRAKRIPGVPEVVLRTKSVQHLARRGHAVRRATIRRYLSGNPSPRLNVGCGPHPLPGWLNADLLAGDIYLDLNRPLPFDDDTFEFVNTEHVIEHVSERVAGRFLADARRVLRPGGTLRVTTPDLQKLIDLCYGDLFARPGPMTWSEYASALSDRPAYVERAQLFNDLLRLWGHRYIYDGSDLSRRLREAGFAAVERFEPGESNTPALKDLEQHSVAGNAADGMSFEAVK